MISMAMMRALSHFMGGGGKQRALPDIATPGYGDDGDDMPNRATKHARVLVLKTPPPKALEASAASA